MTNDGSNAGGSSSATAVYIFFLNLVLIVSKVLRLVVCLVICLNMYSLFHMISILSIILIMFYLAFIMDNSLGKFLYSSTHFAFFVMPILIGLSGSLSRPFHGSANL